MGTFDVSLTGVSADNPIPAVYGEIRFAQGESNGDHGPKTVLIIAPKTSDGSITVDTEIYGPIASEDDALVKVGARSPARAMIRKFLAHCKSALVYVVCPTEATGSAAVDKITISFSSGSNPTAAGVATITFAGETASYAYTTSDTATTIAAGLVSAFNAKTWLPATAANALGVITITGSIAGTELNSIRFRCAVTASTSVVCTVTADTAFGASGASGAAIGVGTISYTSALATILARKFSYIVPHSQEGTPLGALMTQVGTQALPSTGFRQQVIAGSALSPSSAATLASGANLNNARAQLINQEEAPVPHYINAAGEAAIRFAAEVADPSVNLDSYGLKEGQVSPFKRPYNDSAIPTTAELMSMLNNGVTPIGVVAENGTAYLVRSVTTRCKDANSNYDYRARDTSVVTVGDKFLDDATVKLAQAPWTKVSDDPVDPNKQPPAQFATPKRVRASLETLVRDYCDRGWFDPAKRDTILDAIQVGISTLNPSRVDSQVPAYASVNLHTHALLVKESSPAVLGEG